MRRETNPKVLKKAIIIGLALVVIVGIVYVMNYKPKQEIEVGEYKNYQIK